MTNKVHRALTSFAGFLAGVSGLVAASDYTTLGIPSWVGAALGLSAGVIALGATAWRSATDTGA